jgi:hypothetical protein
MSFSVSANQLVTGALTDSAPLFIIHIFVFFDIGDNAAETNDEDHYSGRRRR